MLPATMHHVNAAQAAGLCQSRRGPALVRYTPQVYSGVSAPDCSTEPQCLREEEGVGSLDIQLGHPCIHTSLAHGGAGGSSTLLSTHPSLLCLNY